MTDVSPSTYAVIYTDGGARPTNPGYGGYGWHGYTYQDTPPTKGSGHPRWNLTNTGYVLKSEKEGQSKPDEQDTHQVTPISYIDSFGTVDGVVSNNIAEVVGLTRAVEWAGKQDLAGVVFYTDNKGVVEAASKWIQKWEKNGWVKSNGEPVANKSYLLGLNSAMAELTKNVSQVQYKWIKGHSGDLGNESSDKLATLGTLMAMNDLSHHEVSVEPSQGYWSKKADRPALLDLKSVYFLTDPATVEEGEYYTGSHGADDLFGVKAADARFGYVRLNTPDPALEALRSYVTAQVQNGVTLCHILLNKLFRREEYLTFLKRGHCAIYRCSTRKYDYNYIDKEPIIREFNPPYLAHKAIDELNFLKALYLAYTAGATDLYSKDITDQIYSTHPKKGIMLNPSIGAGLVELSVEVPMNDGRAVKVIIQLGHDCVSRNVLKKIETKKPKIVIICWKQSPEHVRYATYIHTEDGCGVYAGFTSNAVWTDISQA